MVWHQRNPSLESSPLSSFFSSCRYQVNDTLPSNKARSTSNEVSLSSDIVLNCSLFTPLSSYSALLSTPSQLHTASHGQGRPGWPRHCRALRATTLWHTRSTTRPLQAPHNGSARGCTQEVVHAGGAPPTWSTPLVVGLHGCSGRVAWMDLQPRKGRPPAGDSDLVQTSVVPPPCSTHGLQRSHRRRNLQTNSRQASALGMGACWAGGRVHAAGVVGRDSRQAWRVHTSCQHSVYRVLCPAREPLSRPS